MYIIKAGDRQPPLRAQLLDGDGNPIDLSGGSFTITVRAYNLDTNEIAPWSLASEVDESSPPIVGTLGWAEHLWLVGETANATKDDYWFMAEWTITAAGEGRTFPGSAWTVFVIEPILQINPSNKIRVGEVVALDSRFQSVDGLWAHAVMRHVNFDLKESEFSAAQLRLARLYLAAHHFELPPASSLGGQVASMSAGGVSKSYGTPSAMADDLDGTIWGKRYQSIVNNSAARFPTPF